MKHRKVLTKNTLYYLDGSNRKQGELTTWHADGSIRSHAHYKDGMKHGVFIFYNMNGEVYFHKLFIHNEVIYDLIRHTPSGEEMLSISLEHNIPWFYNNDRMEVQI